MSQINRYIGSLGVSPECRGYDVITSIQVEGATRLKTFALLDEHIVSQKKNLYIEKEVKPRNHRYGCFPY